MARHRNFKVLPCHVVWVRYEPGEGRKVSDGEVYCGLVRAHGPNEPIELVLVAVRKVRGGYAPVGINTLRSLWHDAGVAKVMPAPTDYDEERLLWGLPDSDEKHWNLLRPTTTRRTSANKLAA